MTAYESPPILEAVIEVRFAPDLTADAVGQMADRTSPLYANRQQLETHLVNLDMMTQQVEMGPSTTLFKLSSKDQTETLTISPNQFLASKLAPYSGGDAFLDRFIRDWHKCRKITAKEKITRIGMRYINRIDFALGERRNFPNDYVRLNLSADPRFFSKPVVEAVQIQSDYGERPFRLILNAAFADSPIIGKQSIMVDIDVVLEGQSIPTSSVGDIISEMRVVKNEIFESVITERAREGFNR